MPYLYKTKRTIFHRIKIDELNNFINQTLNFFIRHSFNAIKITKNRCITKTTKENNIPIKKRYSRNHNLNYFLKHLVKEKDVRSDCKLNFTIERVK